LRFWNAYDEGNPLLSEVLVRPAEEKDLLLVEVCPHLFLCRRLGRNSFSGDVGIGDPGDGIEHHFAPLATGWAVILKEPSQWGLTDQPVSKKPPIAERKVSPPPGSPTGASTA